MARLYDLGEMGDFSDKQIADSMAIKLRLNKINPENYLYRGLGADRKKLELILATGTDRTIKGWERAAKDLLARDHRIELMIKQNKEMDPEVYGDLTPEKYAMEETDPSITFAVPLERAVVSVGAADRGKGKFQLVLAYQASALEPFFDRGGLHEDKYSFKVSPEKALKFVFRYT